MIDILTQTLCFLKLKYLKYQIFIHFNSYPLYISQVFPLENIHKLWDKTINQRKPILKTNPYNTVSVL